MSTDKPLLATLTRRIHLTIRKRIHAEIQAAGFDDLTPAHLYVFQLPGPEGVRPIELASRMNMSKQATNHLLSSLEARGYIKRSPAEGDGRGTVLHMTPRGRDLSLNMEQSSLRLEAEWARQLGGRALERLRQGLVDLADLTGNV